MLSNSVFRQSHLTDEVTCQPGRGREPGWLFVSLQVLLGCSVDLPDRDGPSMALSPSVALFHVISPMWPASPLSPLVDIQVLYFYSHRFSPSSPPSTPTSPILPS